MRHPCLGSGFDRAYPLYRVAGYCLTELFSLKASAAAHRRTEGEFPLVRVTERRTRGGRATARVGSPRRRAAAAFGPRGGWSSHSRASPHQSVGHPTACWRSGPDQSRPSPNRDPAARRVAGRGVAQFSHPAAWVPVPGALRRSAPRRLQGACSVNLRDRADSQGTIRMLGPTTCLSARSGKSLLPSV